MGVLIFAGVALAGLIFIGTSIARDLSGVVMLSVWPYVLLGTALLVALGFEFVNGFHDTANAVATVIYTHALEPNIAVVWSGFWNFFGVVTSTGAVAFGIVSLLPVELILQVGSSAGFAMVFALLVAAILWNLGTWWLGLPASSSHMLIGSIIGVGIANQLMAARSGTSGVDWAHIGRSLLLSPIFGFVLAYALLILMKAVIKDKRLYEAPKGTEPPPFWIRGLLILTCTGVSFFHGSNDGQKGMGLIMLILIGTVPTTYALNHAVTPRQSQDFIAVSTQAADTLGKYKQGSAAIGDPREDVTEYIRTKEFKPNTMLAMRELANGIGTEMARKSAAEITAMATIGAADGLGLPVSTTQVLSSGVAGTTLANRSGLQWSTVRNLGLAWVLTLPMAMMLSGFLFFGFREDVLGLAQDCWFDRKRRRNSRFLTRRYAAVRNDSSGRFGEMVECSTRL